MDKDEIFNMAELLTTPARDFLLRSNFDRVKVDSLKGKIIGIHFLKVGRALMYQKRQFCQVGQVEERRFKVAVNLLDAYEEHYSKGDFEVVSVAFMGEKEDSILNVEEETLFNQKFSKMPWLVVPFTDTESRKKLTKAFACSMFNSSSQLCSFIDANGKVLAAHADLLLRWYGADFYPFTKQRVNEINNERLPLPDMSLQSLLTAPDRDFVISNQGDKVPISELEGKVVGLYLYGSNMSLPLLPKLHSIYNELKVNRKLNFEIVFVNLHFTEYGCGDEDSFSKALVSMPWLALPFRDKMCRKLWWRYNKWCEVGDSPGEDGVFVVISSDGKSIDPYGAKVIIEYGVDAYPFTREKAAEVEKEIQKQERILPKMIDYAHFLIQNDAVEVIKKVDIGQMFGKSIILFVGAQDVSTTLSFLPEVLSWYEEIRHKDDKFEVIYISRDQGDDIFEYVFQYMPWPAFPSRWWWYDCRGMFNGALDHCFCHCHLIALGQDGVLLTKDATKRLRCRGVDAYPFTDADLLEDVSLKLAERLVWKITCTEGCDCIPNYRPGMQPCYTRGRRR